MVAMAVMDLPEPDSPTTQRVSPGYGSDTPPMASIPGRASAACGCTPKRASTTVPKPGPENTYAGGRCQVRAGAPGGVICVSVGNDGALDWLPGVDEKVTGFAVEAAVGEGEEGHL